MQEAQQKIAQQVPLPAGYRLEWVGEFGELQDAIERLSLIVPLSLALIGVLLFLNFASLTDTVLDLTSAFRAGERNKGSSLELSTICRC